MRIFSVSQYEESVKVKDRLYPFTNPNSSKNKTKSIMVDTGVTQVTLTIGLVAVQGAFLEHKVVGFFQWLSHLFTIATKF